MTWNREPVAIANAINALVASIAPLGVLFGWFELSAEQLAGITTAVIGVGQFVATVFARSKVTPTASL